MDDGNYLSLLTRLAGSLRADLDSRRLLIDWALQSLVTKMIRARWG